MLIIIIVVVITTSARTTTCGGKNSRLAPIRVRKGKMFPGLIDLAWKIQESWERDVMVAIWGFDEPENASALVKKPATEFHNGNHKMIRKYGKINI